MGNIFDIFEKLNSIKPANSGKVEYIIVGLGNPGLQYEKTRHNAGFLLCDYMAQKEGFKIDRIKYSGLCADVTIASKRCLVLKPTTYMNNSGKAVVEAMNFYKIKPENLIVIYDDISLEPSKLRIRRKGSHGGHNGIRDIVELLGSEDFPRIKIGVGAKPNPNYDLADWVLSKFTDTELKQLDIALDNAYESIKLILNGNIDQAMNKYNS